MALLELKTDPTRRELRQFGALVVPLMALVIGAWLFYRFDARVAAIAVWSVGAASLLAGWLRPEWLRPVFVGWMIAAYPIGWIVSHTLLAGIFFLVIAPIGLLLRALGRDPLARRMDRAATSYWEPRVETSDPAQYFRQF